MRNFKRPAGDTYYQFKYISSTGTTILRYGSAHNGPYKAKNWGSRIFYSSFNNRKLEEI